MAKKSLAVGKTVKRRVGKKVSSQHLTNSDQIISRVRELARRGQHTLAIELATETLGRSGLSRSTSEVKRREQRDIQMNLLDLRAEILSRPAKF